MIHVSVKKEICRAASIALPAGMDYTGSSFAA
jgi:hypothetical protein